MMDTKTCTKCGETKSPEAFPPRALVRSRDGRDSACRGCHAEAAALRRAANPEKARAACADWRARNPGASSVLSKAWREANPEKAREGRKRWASANPAKVKEIKAKARVRNLDSERNRVKRWAAANPGRLLANIKRRKQAKAQRTPSWADHEKIVLVYEYSAFLRSLGIDCHVDHIIPLQGKTVSGLHTHDNLQVLLEKENRAKSNTLIADPYSVTPTWRELLKPRR